MQIKEKACKMGKFMKEHKVVMAQLAVMGLVVVGVADTSFAQSGGGGFEVVTGPLEKIKATVKGPVATAVGTIGAALLGVSVATNMENQMAKRGMQVAGGAGLAVGAGKVISTVTSGSGLAILSLL